MCISWTSNGVLHRQFNRLTGVHCIDSSEGVFVYCALDTNLQLWILLLPVNKQLGTQMNGGSQVLN